MASATNLENVAAQPKARPKCSVRYRVAGGNHLDPDDYTPCDRPAHPGSRSGLCAEHLLKLSGRN